MLSEYPTYKYTNEDAQNKLAQFVRLDNPNSYPFDNFHAHEYNEILFFVEGGGYHNINFKNYAVASNAIHLLAAQDLHWLERSMQSSGFAIVYKDQFLHKLQLVNADIDFFNPLSHSQIINLDKEEALSFGFIVNELLNNQQANAYQLQIIGAFITKIITLNKTENKTQKIHDPIIPQILQFIEAHFKTLKTTTEYAALINMGEKTLQNRIKKATGFSLNQLIQERILKEAKKLLCTTPLSIKEVSYELGFKDTAHFTHWFKKKTFQVPSVYQHDR